MLADAESATAVQVSRESRLNLRHHPIEQILREFEFLDELIIGHFACAQTKEKEQERDR